MLTGVDGCGVEVWFGKYTDIASLVLLFGFTTPAYTHSPPQPAELLVVPLGRQQWHDAACDNFVDVQGRWVEIGGFLLDVSVLVLWCLFGFVFCLTTTTTKQQQPQQKENVSGSDCIFSFCHRSWLSFARAKQQQQTRKQTQKRKNKHKNKHKRKHAPWKAVSSLRIRSAHQTLWRQRRKLCGTAVAWLCWIHHCDYHCWFPPRS